MSSKEAEAPATPAIDFPLQAAVYALMEDANVRKYHNYEVGEWTGTVKESAWVIGPFPLKKRPNIDGNDDSVEIERKKKKKKKEDQNPRSELAEEQESLENDGKKKEDHQEPIIELAVQDSLENEEKDMMKPRSEPGEDSQGNERKKKEDDQEPRIEDNQENEGKKKEDDQEPIFEPAEDSRENKEKYQIKPRSEPAQDIQKNVKSRSKAVAESWLNVRKKKEYEKPRSEPVKEYQENERGEEGQIPRIEQENQIAALMLLTYVAKYIRFWRRLHRHNDSKYSPALPAKRRRVDLNDLADIAWQEYQHGLNLEPFAEKLFYDTKAQVDFLKILSDYVNKNNKNPVTTTTVMSEFIKDWVSDHPSVTDWTNAIDFLKMQHQERLRQVERDFLYWDEDELKIFRYGNMIWGSGVDVDSHFTEEKIEKSPIRTRSTALKIQGDRDSQIVEEKTDKSLTKELNEPSTHLDTENAIFERVLLYQEKNGRNPFPDKNDSADFTKNWLRIEVSVEEFNELMNYLRTKYLKIAGGSSILNVGSSKTKDKEVLELAYNIWGW